MSNKALSLPDTGWVFPASLQPQPAPAMVASGVMDMEGWYPSEL